MNNNYIPPQGDVELNSRRNILILFDVDGTLTPARQSISDEVDKYLQSLKERVSVGLVGGSDLNKIAEQTLPSSLRSQQVNAIETCVNRYDYVFAENGLVAYKDGQLLAKQSLIDHIGEKKVQKFINCCLGYMSTLELPVKRGNFIEFRNGLINVCPVGRSCSQKEREEFNNYDKKHQIREKFIRHLESRFGKDSEDPLGLVYSIGGQISFDVYPEGWDKTFCLNLIDKSHQKVYFFGDKTSPGGNDHAIYVDSRTIGHSVTSPADTLAQLEALKL